MQSPARLLPINSNPNTSQPTLDEKYRRPQDHLRSLYSVIIGFSGGADSAPLAKVAYDVLGENPLAVIALPEPCALALAATMDIGI